MEKFLLASWVFWGAAMWNFRYFRMSAAYGSYCLLMAGSGCGNRWATLDKSTPALTPLPARRGGPLRRKLHGKGIKRDGSRACAQRLIEILGRGRWSGREA
jgi:hypothetical protein